ncbi:hypothetical protein QBC38DRAFT_199407 [Podospora fimiseda]|uniref:Secreted protein n=1 Tax=Podospora fimiseda TaxID=252190 RepID=A0AAN7H275_9PEZI|nr:hypothetical protein QBC38DRAFT_199407 [Podospora fimiseda]
MISHGRCRFVLALMQSSSTASWVSAFTCQFSSTLFLVDIHAAQHRDKKQETPRSIGPEGKPRRRIPWPHSDVLVTISNYRTIHELVGVIFFSRISKSQISTCKSRSSKEGINNSAPGSFRSTVVLVLGSSSCRVFGFRTALRRCE